MRSIDETLNALQDELRDVEAALSEPDVASDLTRLRDLSSRHKELAEINHAWHELKAARPTSTPPRRCSTRRAVTTVSNGAKK